MSTHEEYEKICFEESCYGNPKDVPKEVSRRKRAIREEIASYGDPYIEEMIMRGEY